MRIFRTALLVLATAGQIMLGTQAVTTLWPLNGPAAFSTAISFLGVTIAWWLSHFETRKPQP